MIDTIAITTKDFSFDSIVNQHSKLVLQSDLMPVKVGSDNFQPHIITDKNNIEFTGLRLRPVKDNEDKNIKSGVDVLNLSIDNKTGEPSLVIRCSIPKYLTGNNFYLASRGDLIRFCEQLQNDLTECGIYFNVNDCNLSRIDCTKNIETRYSFYQYLPVIKNLNCKRDKKTEVNTETFTVGNTQREVCCYDKISEELNNNQVLPYGITKDSNIFRCESRLLTTKTIKAITKTDSFTTHDLIDCYDDFKSYYKINLKQKLFTCEKMQEIESVIDTESIFNTALSMSDNKVSNLTKLFFDLCVIQASKELIQNLDCNNYIDLYVNYLVKNNIDGNNKRQAISRFRKYFNQHKNYWLSLSLTKDIPIATLYNELYEKLLVA